MKLSDKCLEEGIRVVVLAIQEVAKQDPEEFQTWFMGGILANVFGTMPEELWQKFSNFEPCGKPGCNCHSVGKQVAEALARVRKDYKVWKGTEAGAKQAGSVDWKQARN